MPRRKKQVTADDDEPLARLPKSPEETDGTALMSPTDERRQRELEDVLEDIGQDGRIRVWHLIDGKATYAGEMTMEGFSLDLLLDTFGGGDKTLAFYQGRKRVDTLRIALDPGVPPTSPREKKVLELQAKVGGGGMGAMSELSSFIAAMAQNQMSNMDMFSKMMLLQSQSSAQIMSAVTTMLTARPEKDPTDMLLRVAEVLKPVPAATSELGVFREALKMGMDLGGRDDGGDGTTELLGKGLEVVGAAISAAKPTPLLPAPVAATTPPRQIPPVNNGTSSRVAEPPSALPIEMTPQPNDRPWVRAARPMIPALASALPFMSGDSAAVELLRRASDEVVDDLMNDLDDNTPPGFIGRVQLLFPAFRPTPEWAQQFIDALRDGVTVEDESEEAGEPQALIDKARAASRAKSRAVERQGPMDPANFR